MSLWNKKNKEILLGPLSSNNPVIVQMLGICSALAVTAKLQPAIVMALSVTAVVAFANVIISLLRNTIPGRIRIIVQLVVVAALVTIVSQVLKAFAYDVNKQLSVFVGLIITNCILIPKAKAKLFPYFICLFWPTCGDKASKSIPSSSKEKAKKLSETSCYKGACTKLA